MAKNNKKNRKKRNTYNKRKNHRKRTNTFIFLFLFSIILLGLAYYLYKNYRYSFKLQDSITVPLNSVIDPKSYIKEKENVSVVFKDIDTTTIGEKKIEFIVTDKFKRKHYYYLSVFVTDNTAPIINGKDQITLYKGSKIDYNSYIKISDNYDKNFNINREGEVDVNKVGTYKVKYIVTDSSGNKAEKTISFIIKEKDVTEPIIVNNGVVGTSSKGYKIENKNGATYVGGILIANKSYPVSSSYGKGLTSETNVAFNEMKSAAALAGIDLYIGSGFRSFNTQKSLYNTYVKRDGKAVADTYSARPGYSEHQTGLAIDICSHDLTKACVNSNFNNSAPANWLKDNAHFYGFILRYPNGKSNETGYKYESWHFRYVGKDLASKLYNGGNWITLEDYLGISSKYSN